MSGIYIHIPYCKKVCNYCDFHFSASLRNKEQMVDSICSEAELQKEYLRGDIIDTVYFGGGTPSVLTIPETERILSSIYKLFSVKEKVELTFEANPDDLTPEYLQGLRLLGFNRLSIGIQSFFDADLKWMNRRHNADEALQSIKMSQNAGFDNLNIDLIYGLPCSSLQTWEQNLDLFNTLGIPHLSAYHLTIEPKTILGVLKKKGKVQEIIEEESLQQYGVLLEKTEKWGYLNYEISNFCLDGHFSRHNLNYWNQGLYLGLGPSAHSFNGNSRQWNVSVNQQYINKITNREIGAEMEELSLSDRYNDYILTRLRTMWGIDFDEIKELFGEIIYNYAIKECKQFLTNGLLEEKGATTWLTKKGKFISNTVISGLMYVD
jgi:oxygen-independent coproporphyrinogen III oxidase